MLAVDLVVWNLAVVHNLCGIDDSVTKEPAEWGVACHVFLTGRKSCGVVSCCGGKHPRSKEGSASSKAIGSCMH